jgi:hypothetical protein
MSIFNNIYIHNVDHVITSQPNKIKRLQQPEEMPTTRKANSNNKHMGNRMYERFYGFALDK